MHLTYEWPGERIDTRLSKQFSYSRNFFHHIIERNGIKLNNNDIKKSQKLRDGDHIFIDDLSRYLSPIILEEAPQIDIPILKEELDYLLLNKPKGVLSHPNSIRDVKQPSVVGFLYHHFKHLPTYSNFIRAGLIHRLDKETDGIMIIAKTEAGLQHFKTLFQQKATAPTIAEKEAVPLQKFYRATCETTEIGEQFLKEIKKSWLPFYLQEEVFAKVSNRTPKIGITKIESYNLQQSSNKIFCNLTLQILTWRTHQIRYHLSHHGLPIVGDYLYGQEDELPMQLTAYKLLYQDLDENIQTVEIKSNPPALNKEKNPEKEKSR